MYARMTLIAAFLLVGAGLGCALAQERQYEEPTEADIAIDNSLFFVLRTPAAGFKVVEREKLVNARLVEILSCHRPGPVTISPINGKPTIYVDGVKLVTVYPRDVEANKAKCMMALAESWAANLRAGLPRVMPGQNPDGPTKACSEKRCQQP